jgi:hypothetical protein
VARNRRHGRNETGPLTPLIGMRRLWKSAAALLLTIGFTLFPGQSAACACSCVAASDAEYFEWADTVFTGVVARVDDSSPNHVTFAVEAVGKGDAGQWITLTTEANEAACGMRFEVGQRLRMFGHEGTTGICSGNVLLGLGAVPGGDVPPGNGDRDGLPGIIGVTALVAMAMLIAYVLYRRLSATPSPVSMSLGHDRDPGTDHPVTS